MPTEDYSRFSPFNVREGSWLSSLPDSNEVAAGIGSMDRAAIITNGIVITTQSMRLTYFTAVRDEVVTRIEISTGSTAAAATPTICRMGLYTVASNGDLTLVASTPNDTTLFAAATTVYSKALSASYTLQKGQRYAFGILVVTAVATPTFYGNGQIPAAIAAYNPRISGVVAGQADLPASVANASITTTSQVFFAAFLP